ncbi:MAG: efflux RND transporter periplasmic adaptor subunit [Saprospiraceae bacterium]
MKNLISKIVFVNILLSVLFWSCHDNTDGHVHDENGNHVEAAEADPHEHEEEGGEEVELTKEQIKKIGLKYGNFENRNLQSSLKVNGLLELPPQNKANVSSMVAGKVTKINVKPGQYVRKGATLATIQNPDFITWQQEYLEVEGELMFLEKEYVRQIDLVKKEIAPQSGLDKITSERAIAKAKLQGLKSRMKVLNLPIPTAGDADLKTFLSIVSPLNGFVREIKINTGIFVNPQQDLFEIVDNHHLHIDFMVFEKDLPFVKEGQMISFSLQSQPKNVMHAKIFAIGKSIDKSNRSISVHAEMVDDKTELIPGMYVEGRIILEDRKVPALPEEAVALDNGLYYIFVKEEEHDDEVHFKKVPVLKGVTDFGFFEITPLEKLEESAEIVVDGAYFLMAQSKKGEASGGGHTH